MGIKLEKSVPAPSMSRLQGNIPLHQRKRSEAMDSDEYETEDELFEKLCKKYSVFPTLDVCATAGNTKCARFFSKHTDALKQKWTEDFWMNPPHNKKRINGKMVSQTEIFVRKACKEWEENNVNGMGIIPANSTCTKFAEECIEGKAELHPIYRRPRFLVNGKPAKDSARNSYYCVIWRKRN